MFGRLTATLFVSLAVHLIAFVLTRGHETGEPVIYRQGPVAVELFKEPGKPAVLPKARPVAPTDSDSTETEPETPPSPVATGGSHEVFGEETVDSPAKMVGEPRLNYPALAERQGLEGRVTLLLVVDSDGKVTSAELSQKAGAGFDEAALEAAKGFRFTPALKAGKPVAVRFRWIVRFRLEG